VQIDAASSTGYDDEDTRSQASGTSHKQKHTDKTDSSKDAAGTAPETAASARSHPSARVRPSGSRPSVHFTKNN